MINHALAPAPQQLAKIIDARISSLEETSQMGLVAELEEVAEHVTKDEIDAVKQCSENIKRRKAMRRDHGAGVRPETKTHVGDTGPSACEHPQREEPFVRLQVPLCAPP